MKDLETFRKAYLSDKVKQYPDRLEYRGQNIDIAVPQARQLIIKLNLNLEVYSTGQMAQYKAFEVRIK